MNPPSATPPADDLFPPPDPRAVHRAGAIGVGGCLAAAALGLAGDVEVLSTIRLLLVAGGTLTAGVALSRGPGLPGAWALAALAFLAAVPGLPAHWDSARLLAGVAAAGFGAGTVLAWLPPTPRLSLISLGVLFHFGGIFAATTWPDPTPWLTNQVANRVYMPYLTFLYLRNAYHFYSPEPGPASLLVCLLKYEVDQPDGSPPKTVHEWVVLPRRREHMKDPLGQTYARRLSITEMVSMGHPGLFTLENFENIDVRQRRIRASVVGSGSSREPIPHDIPEETLSNQYKIPQAHISRYLLPSYAKHMAHEFGGPGRRVRSIKMYRVEHRITPPNLFVAGADPYDPKTYRPYYYGEYGPDGTLLNPQDEMLYWLVPVTAKPGGPAPGDPEQRDYVDYLSKHAGFEFDWRRMRP